MTTFRRFNLDEIHEKINKNLKALQILDIGDAYEMIYNETSELLEKMIVENSM